MKKLKADPATPEIIVLTGRATWETAVEAMKHGAYDYITKPYKLDDLVIIINRAYENGKVRIKKNQFQQELLRKESPVEFIGKSSRIRNVLGLVRKIAPTSSNVLIQGESGTGKELVANILWRYSKRSSSPFIALNCATLPETLMESELFGHEKGAFTDAHQTKYGIVEVADKGTLFLDEIGEMSAGLQAKLLRFLDSGEFRRVGSNKPFKVDVRVIAATNKDLSEIVRTESFRQDLYYRLNVMNISIPPLRDRKDDIPELSLYFLDKYSRRLLKNISGFTPEALEALNSYTWPGNVRELENIIERAVILCDAPKIGREELSVAALPCFVEKSRRQAAEELSLEEMEKKHIPKALDAARGNLSKASQLLGIDRKTLYLKLKKYGIDSGRKAPPSNWE